MSIFSRIKSMFGTNKDQQSEPEAPQAAKQAEEQPTPAPQAQKDEPKEPQKELTAYDYFAMAFEEYKRKEIPQAMEHFTKAADMGENNAQNMLGIIYLQGIPGVAPNMAEAERRLRQAAEWGNPEAQFQLAGMHIRGLAPVRNMPEALIWLQKAAMQNYPKAIQALEYLEQQGLIHKA